ncbi:MAG: 23S rRNA (adenine(2503)-C(2))-methyltransferase RlmN [Holosporaceae bacterium]|jgi:23S rRNA (adenine2503-C2)-methyltransferase|nr:23S rRNA (adenine(2503)-C(2))-methyltransferase RlmN [Holosporaceae bacterium]
MSEIIRKNIAGLTLLQLKSEFEKNGLTNLDAKRVFPWIHVKSAKSFEVMSDVPLKVRKFLEENYSVGALPCAVLQTSRDGAQKALLQLEDGNSVETVFIPEEKRSTVCVSSQIGCAMGCKFCYTGTQCFVRNLTSSEIISQVLFWDRDVSNIVFMGMGEPLLNFENLSSTLELLLDEKAHNFSRYSITVSTSGIIENAFFELAKFGVKLAISLHAPEDETRSRIMPINNKYNIKTLISAAKEYQKASNTDCVTFEYLLLKGVNDSDVDAAKLAKLLQSIPAKVNLITFNSWPGSPFAGSDRDHAHHFAKILLAKGIRTTVRKSRGEDILAACGQLKGEK